MRSVDSSVGQMLLRISCYLVTFMERPTVLCCIWAPLSSVFVRLRHTVVASPCCVTFAFVNMPHCLPLFYSWRAFGLFPAVVRNTIAENFLLLDLKKYLFGKDCVLKGMCCDDLMHYTISFWNVSYWTYVCIPIMGWSCWDREHILNFSRCCQIVFQKCLYQFTLPPVSMAVPCVTTALFILDSINF